MTVKAILTRARRRRAIRRTLFGIAGLVLAVTLYYIVQEQHAQADRIAALEQYQSDLADWRRSMEQWEDEKKREEKARESLLLTLRRIQDQLDVIDAKIHTGRP